VKSSPRNATTGSAGATLTLATGLVTAALAGARLVTLSVATGDDDADTAGGKLGGTIATAFVRVESRSRAMTTTTNATTASAATPAIDPRLYMADRIWRRARVGQSRLCGRARQMAEAE
jgi:hypothetical protein